MTKGRLAPLPMGRELAITKYAYLKSPKQFASHE